MGRCVTATGVTLPCASRTVSTGFPLEANGHVASTWDAGDGPARRNYSLTRSGHVHLRDWAHLLESLGKAMIQFAHETHPENDSDDLR